MTDETTIQRVATRYLDRALVAERQISNLTSKLAKQRSEIARLTQRLEKLTAEKAALHCDLCMERAKAE
jgi:peptidoglycan hydrolase CwlO-like protein